MSERLSEFEAEVRNDPDSLGLILHGSRAVDGGRPDSDYDLIRVVTDEAHRHRAESNTLLERREQVGTPRLDVLYQTPARLRFLAKHPDWWTSTYATASVLVDKTGDVHVLVNAIVKRGGLEHCWPPYNDQLGPRLKELEAAQRWEPGFLRATILQVLEGGEPLAQLRLEGQVESLMSARGFPHEWGDDLDALKATHPDRDGSQLGSEAS